MSGGGWRRNIIVQAVIGELEAVGIKAEIEKTSHHYKLWWIANGQKRLYVVSSSPSCRLAHKKARCDVRRMLKTDGVIFIDERE